jgi:SAM-dependent methyltransferase
VGSLIARLFHAITYKHDRSPSTEGEWEYAQASLERYLGRFGPLDFRDKTVLDVGCGSGILCAEAARRGAAHVVGVDLDVTGALRYIAARRQDVASTVEFIATDGSLAELHERQFDLVVSKDSFEHYADPERFMNTIKRLIRPGGQLLIGFGPLWKSPTGGHIDYMTPLPWAHLIFPERVIFEERRRFRPRENAQHWAEIRGGLNQMTYNRFATIVRTSGLERRYFQTNVSDNPYVKVMNGLSKIPGLREYFTANIYIVLRRLSSD